MIFSQKMAVVGGYRFEFKLRSGVRVEFHTWAFIAFEGYRSGSRMILITCRGRGSVNTARPFKGRIGRKNCF